MNKTELLFASSLLRMAADEFSNHGANDFKLPNTPEIVELLNKMEAWNVRNSKDKIPNEVHVYNPNKSCLYTMDWYLMAYFSAQLKEMANETPPTSQS